MILCINCACEHVHFSIFFSFLAFATLMERGFKVFAFDIVQVSLIVPLYLLTDCRSDGDNNHPTKFLLKNLSKIIEIGPHGSLRTSFVNVRWI